MKRMLQIFIQAMAILFVSVVHAQVRTVSGTVTAKEDGQPLSGVTVLIKGTSQGGNTDENGQFTITVPEDARELEFRYIGYLSQTVAISTTGMLNVALEADANELSEVVVVGYTAKQVSELSSSVSVVSGEKLRDVTSNDVSSMLQGKAPGVIVSSPSGDPNATPSLPSADPVPSPRAQSRFTWSMVSSEEQPIRMTLSR
ncbi:hypothetical protein GCM10011386_22830 [Parapedobacter defluvii]|uniref:CarboxypepD_reg-like domain-containing protein n=1 Tax=Parapedobacter defluvii TaxID=2045106 RepID=A0ABQ1LVB8_9SPHI|nr:carboxypeptidase-like regulatory domain-containing protein [Parapedobacter defluvii]GGC30257.1 hypothetical protein GCM10011386_22830 [Parapedobacter defluvii]